MKTKLKLGDLAKDTMTGYTGHLVARAKWLHGCDRLAIEPHELKDGQLQDAVWFDEQRVELVEQRAVVDHTAPSVEKKPGGPRPDPVRRIDR